MKPTHYYIIGFLTLIFSLLASFSTPASAQKRRVMNRPYIDQRFLHWGFHAGLHMQDIEFQHSGYMDEDGNQWFTEAPNYEPGFTVGILGEMRLNKYLGLRLLPSMHFGTKNLTFKNAKSPDIEKQYQSIKSTYLSIPLDLKFSGERFNNFRPYAMFGVNPMVDLTVKKQKQVLLKRFDLYLEAGFGCDFYSPWFKFIPEIKFCWGLLNVLDKNTSDLNDPNILIFRESLSKARSKMIVITFYFE